MTWWLLNKLSHAIFAVGDALHRHVESLGSWLNWRAYHARQRAARREDLGWGGAVWTGKDFPF